MDRIDMSNRQTGETKELKGVRKTSEEVKAECDVFLANGGQVEQIDNLGNPAAMNQTMEIEKLARNWISNHFPKKIAMAKAGKLGIKFKLVVEERNRRIARGRKL